MKRGQYFFSLPGIDFLKDIVQGESAIDATDTLDTKIDYEHVPMADTNEQLRTTMFDIIEQKILPLTTDKDCWWCRHPFPNSPIGCPLNYVAKGCPEFEKFCEKKNIILTTKDYFETEGIFCSFNCCKAFIVDNSRNHRYKESGTLLSLLHVKLMDTIPDIIIPADSWQILRKNLGWMDIDTYRNKDQKIYYQITPNVKRPFMFTMGHYVQKII